jgi:hypothetical protein
MKLLKLNLTVLLVHGGLKSQVQALAKRKKKKRSDPNLCKNILSAPSIGLLSHVQFKVKSLLIGSSVLVTSNSEKKLKKRSQEKLLNIGIKRVRI